MKIALKNFFILFIVFILTAAALPSDLLICYGADGHVEIELANAKKCKIDNNTSYVNNFENEEITKNADSGCADYYLSSLNYYTSFSKRQVDSPERVVIPFKYAELIKPSSNDFQKLQFSLIILTQVKTLFLSEILLI